MNDSYTSRMLAALASKEGNLSLDADAMVAIYEKAVDEGRLNLPTDNTTRQWIEGVVGILREVARRGYE